MARPATNLPLSVFSLSKYHAKSRPGPEFRSVAEPQTKMSTVREEPVEKRRHHPRSLQQCYRRRRLLNLRRFGFDFKNAAQTIKIIVDALGMAFAGDKRRKTHNVQKSNVPDMHRSPTHTKCPTSRAFAVMNLARSNNLPNVKISGPTACVGTVRI